LASRTLALGTCRDGADVCLHRRLQPSLAIDRASRDSMLILTGIVTLLVFVYLLAALLRPEWF
jgi:K+-transporting ATPase KdpF subunit